MSFLLALHAGAALEAQGFSEFSLRAYEGRFVRNLSGTADCRSSQFSETAAFFFSHEKKERCGMRNVKR